MERKVKYIINVVLLLTLVAACQQRVSPEPGGETLTPISSALPISTETNTSATISGMNSTDTPSSMSSNCNIEWSRLRVGYDAVVTYGDRSNRVRSAPVKDLKNIIAYIYPGTVVKVVEGPVCSDGYVFWRVTHSSIPGGSGWTAEGNGNKKHWLDPSNCASDLTNIYVNHFALVRAGVNGLRVYDKQGSDGQVIAYISAPQSLKVEGGPYCTTDQGMKLIYWKVDNQSNPNSSGWVAQAGKENGEYISYLQYDSSPDVTAFPIPPTLASIAPEPQTASTFKLSDLFGLGTIAYISNDWVWVINADGTSPYELKNPLGKYDTPHFISWSPDGKFIANAIAKKMFILSADGKIAREPVDKASNFSDINWSPDSQYLAYSAENQGADAIFVVKTDGSDLHLLNNGLSGCYHADWSPFGTYILYTCYQDGDHIYLSAYNIAGKTTFGTMGHIASWSSDGKYIAYSDIEDGISIMDALGTHAHTLLGEDVTFTWSPDGKSIALIYDDQIFLVNVSDGKVRNLTGHNISLPYSFPYGWLSWSPDSNYIVYSFNFMYDCPNVCDLRTSPVYITEVKTGARLELVDKGTFPAWSPTKTSAIKQLPDCTSGWTRLDAGGHARVMGAPTDPPNRVRSGSSKIDTQIGVIYPGTILQVLEGPVCADGLVFWKVVSDAIPGGTGWTAEGDNKAYYLEPYQP